MKKLALVLGSLLVATTAVQAKEVVAPVENSKEVAPVAAPVVEPVAFRPSGYLGFEYRAYGDTEGQNDKTSNHDTWNRGANRYSRLQTTFGVQATENFKIEGRIRDYNNLERNDKTSRNGIMVPTRDNAKEGTETRLRFYYKHNDLVTSRLEYKDYTDGTQKFEYQARINAYQNEGGLLSSVVVAPAYAYYYGDDGISGKNMLGTYVYYEGNLPFGFTYDGELNFYQFFYNDTQNNGLTKGMDHYREYDKDFNVEWKLILHRTWNLYTADKYAVDFNFEGGYDPYYFREFKMYNDKGQKLGKNTYELYTSLDVTVNYQVTEYLSVNGGVGAEYRNWSNTWQDSAKDWRWQPFAFAGMKVTF